MILLIVNRNHFRFADVFIRVFRMIRITTGKANASTDKQDDISNQDTLPKSMLGAIFLVENSCMERKKKIIISHIAGRQRHRTRMWVMLTRPIKILIRKMISGARGFFITLRFYGILRWVFILTRRAHSYYSPFLLVERVLMYEYIYYLN